MREISTPPESKTDEGEVRMKEEVRSKNKKPHDLKDKHRDHKEGDMLRVVWGTLQGVGKKRGGGNRPGEDLFI